MEEYLTVPYRLCGLDYIFLQDAPVVTLPGGTPYLDIPMAEIEKAIARTLIEERVPLHGAEVRFLRRALHKTLQQWADRLGVTAAAVLKWERGLEKRLTRINEAAVRSLCAEELQMPLGGHWSVLIARDETPEKLLLRVG